MASSIEDILYAKALADAEARPGYGAPVGLGAVGGAVAGMSMPGNFKTRMAGGLVGAIMGGGLGAGMRNMAVQESPAAAILAKLQSTGTLNPMDRAQLQSVLKGIYNNPGM